MADDPNRVHKACIRAVEALLEIGQGHDSPRTHATEALIEIAELMGTDPLPFQLAQEVLHAMPEDKR